MKALILDEAREKFLITLEDNGWWELPGGGLEWGESAAEGLAREIQEEMGLEVTWVADRPCYLLQGKNMKGVWSMNILFETKVKDLDFTPSEECQEIRFVSPEEVREMHAFRNVMELADLFKPENH